MDKLFVYRMEDKNFRECVNCDFIEQQEFVAIPLEPNTRATRDSGVNEEQVVRLITPSDS